MLFGACAKKAEEGPAVVRPVKSEKAVLLSGLETYAFSGITKAQNETNLSFKVAGNLASVHVRLGEQVVKGQLIATMDPIDYSIQSNQASAQKEGAIANAKAAEAQWINAKATYNRVARLYENNSVSLSEYQQAKAGVDAAQAQYEAAKSQIDMADQQLKAAGNQLSYTRLTSPMDGIITAVEVEANEVVNAGMLIAKVSALGLPEVEVGIPEVAINKLSIGQRAQVKFSALPASAFEAEIVEIAFASGRSTTYSVTLKILNPKAEIRPGMATEVYFKVRSESGAAPKEVVVPLKAVANGVDGSYVFKLLPEAEPGVYVIQKIPVELGPLSPIGYVVKAGLKEGELVAVAGLRSLYEGQKVSLLKDESR